MEKFELTQDESIELKRFIAEPPTNPDKLRELNQALSKITQRVMPLFMEGKTLSIPDRNLIDCATGVVAEIENLLETATTTAYAIKLQLHFLYTGTGIAT